MAVEFRLYSLFYQDRPNLILPEISQNMNISFSTHIYSTAATLYDVYILGEGKSLHYPTIKDPRGPVNYDDYLFSVLLESVLSSLQLIDIMVITRYT